MNSKIIAVDFDGTLCKDCYPVIGAEKWRVIRKLLRRQKKGAKIILNTCRSGAHLRKAVLWCRNRGIMFDAINENLPELIVKYGGDCRKISADEYWDDRARRIW